MTTECSFPGCDREHHARGLCAAHANQRLRGSELKPLRPGKLRGCDFPGCERAHQARGLCKSHLAQHYSGIPLAPLRPTSRPGAKPPCSFEGCDRVSDARTLCRAHYNQHRAGKTLAPIGATYFGRPTSPQREPKPKPLAKAARPRRPKSKLPPGWERKATRPEQTVAIAGGVREIGPTKPTKPHLIAAALDTLAEWDALDLADMLGLTGVAA